MNTMHASNVASIFSYCELLKFLFKEKIIHCLFVRLKSLFDPFDATFLQSVIHFRITQKHTKF